MLLFGSHLDIICPFIYEIEINILEWFFNTELRLFQLKLINLILIVAKICIREKLYSLWAGRLTHYAADETRADISNTVAVQWHRNKLCWLII